VDWGNARHQEQQNGTGRYSPNGRGRTKTKNELVPVDPFSGGHNPAKDTKKSCLLSWNRETMLTPKGHKFRHPYGRKHGDAGGKGEGGGQMPGFGNCHTTLFTPPFPNRVCFNNPFHHQLLFHIIFFPLVSLEQKRPTGRRNTRQKRGNKKPVGPSNGFKIHRPDTGGTQRYSPKYSLFTRATPHFGRLPQQAARIVPLGNIFL